MWRHRIRPRDDWQRLVTEQGLVFPVTTREDGTTTPYWNESAWYELTLAEVEALEAATEELWAMCVDAVGFMASPGSGITDARLGMPAGSLDYLRRSVERRDPMLYARFDLAYGADGSIKMLEVNGDTPTGLVETGVIQWSWLEEVMPDLDQWNSVHDRLVAGWRRLAASGGLSGNRLHLLYDVHPGEDYDDGELEMTVAYLQDTAVQAGLSTLAQPIEEVGWNPDDNTFRDINDEPIRNAFKLYAWEEMLAEQFGLYLLEQREPHPVRWIEPPWKALLSTKAVLPVLWQRNPGHRLLLPAYFDGPGDLTEWVAKPLHGREGDNIRLHLADGYDVVTPGGYGHEPLVYQQYTGLPVYEGNYVVLGSWIVDNEAAGLLVRESDGPITDYYSRVCPHVISDNLSPNDDQVAAWLADRVGPQPPSLRA
jgi:glutathionylspermidine synthase